MVVECREHVRWRFGELSSKRQGRYENLTSGLLEVAGRESNPQFHSPAREVCINGGLTVWSQSRTGVGHGSAGYRSATSPPTLPALPGHRVGDLPRPPGPHARPRRPRGPLPRHLTPPPPPRGRPATHW